MRAVFATFFAACVIAMVVSANSLTRQKRGAGAFSAAGMPFGAFSAAGMPSGAFAGSGIPFGAGGGAFAGPGFGGNGFYPYYGDGFPFRFMPMPVVPQFTFPTFKNWFEGPNVCKEQKIINAQGPADLVPDEWKDGMPNVNTDSRNEQESCKGSDRKYICVKRIMGSNGEGKIQATKYECCPGFVRDPSGNPGCTENLDKVPHQ